MKKIITILFLSLIASPCLAGNVYLSPGKFQPEESLLGNKPYKFSFFVSNNTESTIKVKTAVECIDAAKGNCGDADWYKINPSKEFSLPAQESRKIEVTLKVDKNSPNKKYENVFVVYPQIADATSSNTKMTPALGGLITFTKSGKINKLQEMIYWLKDNVGNKAVASAAAVAGNVPASSLVLMFSSVIALLIVSRLFTLLKNKRRLAVAPTFADFEKWDAEKQEKYLKQKGPDVDFIVKEAVKKVEQITNGNSLTKEQKEMLPKKIRKHFD